MNTNNKFELFSPTYGWAHINISSKDFDGKKQTCSIPVSTVVTPYFIINMMDCLTTTIKNKKETVLYIDGEGEETHIIFRPHGTIVIHEKDKRKTFYMDYLYVDEIAKNVYEEVSNNLNKWKQDFISEHDFDESAEEKFIQSYKEFKNLMEAKNQRG